LVFPHLFLPRLPCHFFVMDAGPSPRLDQEDEPMNENRIKGEAHALKGSIKEAIGKITGDRRIEAEGAAEKLAGKAQAGAGEIVETVKKAGTK
jgi:uncharacterized protein YjbJ (UPF0337 family)